MLLSLAVRHLKSPGPGDVLAVEDVQRLVRPQESSDRDRARRDALVVDVGTRLVVQRGLDVVARAAEPGWRSRPVEHPALCSRVHVAQEDPQVAHVRVLDAHVEIQIGQQPGVGNGDDVGHALVVAIGDRDVGRTAVDAGRRRHERPSAHPQLDVGVGVVPAEIPVRLESHDRPVSGSRHRREVARHACASADDREQRPRCGRIDEVDLERRRQQVESFDGDEPAGVVDRREGQQAQWIGIGQLQERPADGVVPEGHEVARGVLPGFVVRRRDEGDEATVGARRRRVVGETGRRVRDLAVEVRHGVPLQDLGAAIGIRRAGVLSVAVGDQGDVAAGQITRDPRQAVDAARGVDATKRSVPQHDLVVASAEAQIAVREEGHAAAVVVDRRLTVGATAGVRDLREDAVVAVVAEDLEVPVGVAGRQQVAVRGEREPLAVAADSGIAQVGADERRHACDVEGRAVGCGQPDLLLQVGVVAVVVSVRAEGDGHPAATGRRASVGNRAKDEAPVLDHERRTGRVGDLYRRITTRRDLDRVDQ